MRIGRLALLMGAVLLVGVGAVAQTMVAPDAARTYCHTDPLYLATDATDTGGTTVFTDDQVASFGGGIPFTNEVVWRIIGTLPQSAPGEAYCGALGNATTLGGPFVIDARGSTVLTIQDCLGVLRFEVPSTSPAYRRAALHWEGSLLNGGVYSTIAVSICKYDDPAFALDDEGDPGTSRNPDCIIDNLDFGGGSFVAIHDVQNRKADNNLGLVGGVTDINFLDGFPVRDIELSRDAVAAINDAMGGTIVFIMRCADSKGTNYGFLGDQDNGLVIHDPPGVGFGFPGTTDLYLYNE